MTSAYGKMLEVGMAGKQSPVRGRQAMLAGMTPVLHDGVFVFCTTTDMALAEAAMGDSLAMFREAEGVTLVLSDSEARRYGFDIGMPMRQIVLEVFSALDGVGLTAGVAAALADHGIPCNMIAAYHHDHVFVPEAMAPQALAVLKAVQQAAAEG